MSELSQSLIDVGSRSTTGSVEDNKKLGGMHNQRALRKKWLILFFGAVFFLTLVTNWSPQTISSPLNVAAIQNQRPEENEITGEEIQSAVQFKNNNNLQDGRSTVDVSGGIPSQTPEDGEPESGTGSGADDIKVNKEPPQIAQPSPDTVSVVNNDETPPPKEIGPDSDPDAIYKNIKSIWTHRCDPSRGCIRELLKPNETVVEPEVCYLNCGEVGALWPYPIRVNLGQCLTKFGKSDLKLGITTVQGDEAKSILLEMWNVFSKRLDKLIVSRTSPKLDSNKEGEKNSVQVNIIVSGKSTKISLSTDEPFTITIDSSPPNPNSPSTDCDTNQSRKVVVEIQASTVFGARHALESLSQLIAFDKTEDCFQIVNPVKIDDKPAFPYRGILIDTARNFIPISDLKRLIDGLSLNKLNVLHWHISDSNSFPFYSKRVPQMTLYGAYSPEKIYYPNEIKNLVRYALIRGVKVIPEIDAPSHAGNGWQWGPNEGLGDLAVCVNSEPWRRYCGQPPCGQLNPINPNTLTVLEKLYQDFFEVFDEDLFHMGGDEVYEKCWESDPEISSWLQRERKSSYLDLWGKFQNDALLRLKGANQDKPLKAIVWTGGMTATPKGRRYLNSSNYIIQVWDGSPKLVRDLLQENYQLIMSNIEAAYLDQGGGTWLGMEHVYPYRLWQDFYDNQLSKFMRDLSSDMQKPPSERLMLGSEATLWTEKVNSQNIDSRTWPRGAALAENLWSNPVHRTPLVYSRLNHHNRRLIALGIHSNQLQPENCYLNGHCDDPQSHI